WGLAPPSGRPVSPAGPVSEVGVAVDLSAFGPGGMCGAGGPDAIRSGQLEAAECPIHSYGVGMAISAAPPIAFTADIKEISGKPMTKRGRIPGAQPNERLARVI